MKPWMLLAAALPLAGQVKFNGLLDGYTTLTLRPPDSSFARYWGKATDAPQARLNMALGGISLEKGALRGKVSLGAGDMFNILTSGEPDNVSRYIPEAIIAWDFAKQRGGVLEFGKFYTSAGPDTAETLTAWNYTKSLVFMVATPNYHFGAKITAPQMGSWQFGAQVVNGWNNVLHYRDAWMGGATAAYKSKYFDWNGTYYGGQQGAAGGNHERHILDQFVLVRVHPKLTLLVEGDAASDDNSRWSTLYGALRWAPHPRVRIAPRWEALYDSDGFTTGHRQRLEEFTLTGEYRVTGWLWSRLEYRRDWSNLGSSQNTFLLGVVTHFGFGYN